MTRAQKARVHKTIKIKPIQAVILKKRFFIKKKINNKKISREVGTLWEI